VLVNGGWSSGDHETRPAGILEHEEEVPMTRKMSPRLASILVAALLGLGSPLLACQREEKSGVEKLSDKAKDALDVREHEKLKDAGEDVEAALEDAGAAAKEEAESRKKKAQ
jgi:hypothetical protein